MRQLLGLGIDDGQYRRHAATVAGGFNQWHGLLIAKLWLHDPHTSRYGGAYLFADQAAAGSSRATALFLGMSTHPASQT
ncbi:MAG: YdhR family protein [Ilumatobacteraceae bacterium]